MEPESTEVDLADFFVNAKVEAHGTVTNPEDEGETR
jgi:hypothetical protein